MADQDPVEVTPEEEDTPKKEEESEEAEENKEDSNEEKNDEPEEEDKKENVESEDEKKDEAEGGGEDEKEEPNEEDKEEVSEDPVVESEAIQSNEGSGATAPEEEEENKDEEDEATNETNEEDPLDPDRVKAVFNVFQKDDVAPVSEIGSMIRSLGFNPLDEEIDEIIKPYSEDSVESIDFEIFKTLVEAEKEKRKDIDEDQRFKEAFEIFDKEHTGKISKNELKEVLTTMGSMKLTEEEADDVINKLELDEDENISHEAIIKLLRS
ncbi:uncharacterized protein [Lepeophtheirus salmonis]|uniref:uncharacterized protein n=1 Tax=Lepeophtheirus salmonis TaxID=72036 RepID=UPI001AE21B51|nr:calmodulin-like [Lepeophtheirus salmonis]